MTQEVTFNLTIPLSEIGKKFAACKFNSNHYCTALRHYLKGGYDLMTHCQNCRLWKTNEQM